jgi:hypothetical protein
MKGSWYQPSAGGQWPWRQRQAMCGHVCRQEGQVGEDTEGAYTPIWIISLVSQ